MNFLQAMVEVKESNGAKCCRSLNWPRGIGISYDEFKGGFTEIPNDCGGAVCVMPSPRDLFGEWVVFSVRDEFYIP